MQLRWHDRPFGELSVVDLYAIFELRERVFVVEQSCAYLDADGLDRVARHLWAEPDGGDPRDEGLRDAGPRDEGPRGRPGPRGKPGPRGRPSARTPTSDAIVAYLRIVPAGAKFAEVSLGRIVTAPEVRRTGLGRTLVQRGLAAVGPIPVRIEAQAHLERFYGGFGFRRVSEPYLEDGIPHIEMLRA